MPARPFFPLLFSSSRVGISTREWWEAIGRSLMAFTEIEQSVIDWAVLFANDPALWQTRFRDDLKALVPELRRSLKKAGEHRLSGDTRSAIAAALCNVENLTDIRNDIAHMRLCFQLVPLAGDNNENEWIPAASHVEIRLRVPGTPELESRDLDWVRSAAKTAQQAGREFQAIMEQVAVALGLSQRALDGADQDE